MIYLSFFTQKLFRPHKKYYLWTQKSQRTERVKWKTQWWNDYRARISANKHSVTFTRSANARYIEIADIITWDNCDIEQYKEVLEDLIQREADIDCVYIDCLHDGASEWVCDLYTYFESILELNKENKKNFSNPVILLKSLKNRCIHKFA